MFYVFFQSDKYLDELKIWNMCFSIYYTVFTEALKLWSLSFAEAQMKFSLLSVVSEPQVEPLWIPFMLIDGLRQYSRLRSSLYIVVIVNG